MLGFQSGPDQGGREGLQPLAAWLQVVKLQALASYQVALDTQLQSVWSWGWGTFNTVRRRQGQAGRGLRLPVGPEPRALPAGANARRAGLRPVALGRPDPLPPNILCNFQGGQLTVSDRDAASRLAGGPVRALTALLERSILTTAAPAVTSNDVRKAERGIIAVRFNGDRQAFLDALARKGLTEDDAFQILGDQLRRRTIQRSLRVPQPTGAQLTSFAKGHGGTLTRKIEVHPAAPWLGGRTKGIAVGGVAPKVVFTAPQGRWITVVTPSGRYRVHVVGKKVPLRRVDTGFLRPGLGGLLQQPVRVSAFTSWLGQKQTAAIGTATCLRDELPAAGDVDLTAGRTFLRVDTLS